MAGTQRKDWDTIRAEYEAGATMGDLSRRHGVDKSAISRRAKKEGWLQDVSSTVNRLTEAKVNGIVNTVDPKKKVEALSRAADAKAAVILRHKAEWDRHQALINAAVDAGDFDAAKLAKITAETIKIRQEGERKAWGIMDKLEHVGEGGGPITITVTRFSED
jgi:transposase-like protein